MTYKCPRCGEEGPNIISKEVMFGMKTGDYVCDKCDYSAARHAFEKEEEKED